MSAITIAPAAGNVSAFNALGVPLMSTTNAAEALEKGGLSGWNLRKVPAYCYDENGKKIAMEGRNAIIWDDPTSGKTRFMGDVGNAHTLIQNEEQVEFLNTFAERSGATFETAGIARKGRVVFVTLKLPGDLNIGSDKVDNYVASINSHDGSMQHTMMVAPMRFACMNMFNMALKNHSHMIRVRHTRNAVSRLRTEADMLLDQAFAYMDEFKAVADQLANTALTQDRFEQIILEEFGPTEDMSPAISARRTAKVDEMFALFAGNTVKGVEGTAWAGFNAITEWLEHDAPVRDPESAAIVRAERSLFNSSSKERALELMLSVG